MNTMRALFAGVSPRTLQWKFVHLQSWWMRPFLEVKAYRGAQAVSVKVGLFRVECWLRGHG